MPQIPFEISKQTIPGKSDAPYMSGDNPIYTALERAGKQMESQNMTLFQTMQNAERYVEASKTDNYLREWIAKKAEGLRGRTDYENFDKEYEDNKKE